MNRVDLMRARMRRGWDAETLAIELGIKKRQVDAWDRYDHVPDDWVDRVNKVCGIVVKKSRKHPPYRTGSGVRFGWEDPQ